MFETTAINKVNYHTIIDVPEHIARDFTKVVENFSINQATIIMAIALIMLIGIFIAQEIIKYKTIKSESNKPEIEKYNKPAKPKNNGITNIITTILFGLMLIVTIELMSIHTTYTIAKEHGYGENNETMHINHVWQSIDLSPVEDILPENLDGTLIIYYKFGCPDCEAVDDEIYEQTKNLQNIYWIATRSKTGSQLLKEYPVTKVPAGVFIKSSKSFITRTLYDRIDDETHLNKEGLNELINDFVQNGKTK